LEAPKTLQPTKQKRVFFRPPLTPPQKSPNADLRKAEAVEAEQANSRVLGEVIHPALIRALIMIASQIAQDDRGYLHA
jgi:hypothetical protein